MRKEGSEQPNPARPQPLPVRPLFRLLYNLFLALYPVGVRITALFNAKAGKWLSGRKNWEAAMTSALQSGERRIWVHCSSVGEFEQARPLIEALKQQYPGYKIVLTFFSPSGYSAMKGSQPADYIFYLPHDGKRNARRFIELVDPAIAVFVKYEFWYYYLARLRQLQVPALLVSGVFRNDQPFFKWYGGLFRDMLQCFSFFFVQDAGSQQALQQIGFTNAIVSGDTRYDRVAAIAQNSPSIPGIAEFRGSHHLLIAGSTWPSDENVLKDCIGALPEGWKLIVAPHEVNDAHIRQVQKLFGEQSVLYSDLVKEPALHAKRILIINNIGMLSRLFAYGDIAFIGGGFDKEGIHNILEPAVFGLPVIFGPVYDKYIEAVEMVSQQHVFPVKDSTECAVILKKLIADDDYRKFIGQSVRNFMQAGTGATQAIMSTIANEEWL